MSFDTSKWIQNILDGLWPQFSKLGPVAKMDMQADSSNFFHPKSTKIDEKMYYYSIHINVTSEEKHMSLNIRPT